MVLETDRPGRGPSGAPAPVGPSIVMSSWTFLPFHTTVTRASAVLRPLSSKRAARNVTSYVCQVSGAVAALTSGAFFS